MYIFVRNRSATPRWLRVFSQKNGKPERKTKMSRSRSLRWLVVAALVLGATHSAWATSANNNDNATVQVQPVLSITDEVGNFTIQFNDATGSATGSISTGQTVGYIVKSNTMPNAALAGALSAKINTTLTNIQLRASTDGSAYVNGGTASNAVLTPVNTDTNNPTVVGTTAVAIFDKPASSGAAGKVLNGTAYINWNAKATADLVPGDGGTVTITTTLKDA